MKLVVNPRNNRNGIRSVGLRNQPGADRFQGLPLSLSEEPPFGYLGQPLPNNFAHMVVP